jgi:hypothetical protein
MDVKRLIYKASMLVTIYDLWLGILLKYRVALFYTDSGAWLKQNKTLKHVYFLHLIILVILIFLDIFFLNVFRKVKISIMK